MLTQAKACPTRIKKLDNSAKLRILEKEFQSLMGPASNAKEMAREPGGQDNVPSKEKELVVIDSEILWEGESKDLTSVATGGRVVKKRYKITREFIFEDAGIIGSREEQIPLWAIRDVDVKQSMLQKTRNVGDLTIRIETNDYTGKRLVVLESIETPKEVRNIINEHSRFARELKLRQQQSVNYSGGPAGPGAIWSGQQTSQKEDPIEKLYKLGALLKEGLISQEEFETQKKKLLG